MPVRLSSIVLHGVVFSLLRLHYHNKIHYHHTNCIDVFIIKCEQEKARVGLYVVLVTFNVSLLGFFLTPAPCK
jgi:hypothetical protein